MSNTHESATPPPSSDPSEMKFFFAALCLAAAFAAATVVTYSRSFGPGEYPLSIDFYNFWSGFKIFERGENVYDHSLLLKQELSLSSHVSGPFYYPPWMLAFLFPILKLDFTYAAAAFSALNTALIIVLGPLTWRLAVGHLPTRISQASIFALLFIPAINALQFGQISIIVTFALYATWYLLEKKRYWLAGLPLAFTAIKPQSCYLLLAALTLHLIRSKQLKPLIVAGLLVTAAIAWCEFICPGMTLNWLSQIKGTSQHAAVSAVTPLRALFWNFSPYIAERIPVLLPLLSLLVVSALNLLGKVDLLDRRSFIVILFASVMTSPYIWIFDHTILLILQIAILAQVSSRNPRQFSLCSGVVFLYQGLIFYAQTLNVLDARLWWFPVPLFAAWYLIQKRSSNEA